MKIKSVHAREILDSRGNPTIEVEVESERGHGTGIAPSGASTGAHEAVELRDAGTRYGGKGVLRAVENVNTTIAKAFIKGKAIKTQQEADERLLVLNGTPTKAKLGANATTATSMAIARCFASEKKIPYFQYLGGKKLPQPMFNILNGGKHAGGKLAIQEFMIMPKADSFSEVLRKASEIYHVLGKNLVNLYGPSARNIGDEGGYAPSIGSTEEALNVIWEAVEQAGYAKETSLALDCAASSFYDPVTKSYAVDDKQMSKQMLLEFYLGLAKKYPIASIEDPFEEEDFESFAAITKALQGRVQIVGDDILVTNPQRIAQAVEAQACNSLLLKVNQIGTVSEALQAAQMCRTHNWTVVVSHRSGETEDTFIADFAVGIEAEYIKTGAPARGERTAKYNQLLRIEEMLRS